MKQKGNLFSFPFKDVGYELSSRVVSNQVFSPLQRLTSVFGMGTGVSALLWTPVIIILLKIFYYVKNEKYG